jgi:hypothetical protein
MDRRSFGLMAAVLVMGTAGAIPAYGQSARSETYYIMEFSKPVEGRQDDYNRWYETRRLHDLLSVPGFVAGERFELNDPQMYSGVKLLMPKYLALYTIRSADIGAVLNEINRRPSTVEMFSGSIVDQSSLTTYVYRFSAPEQRPEQANPAADKPGRRVKYFHFVFNVPLEAKKAEFDKWYDEVHNPSMLRGPGYVSAQRLVLALPSRAAIQPTDALATFRIDLPESVPITEARNQPHPNGVSAATMLDLTRNRGYTYRQIGGPVSAGAD